MRPWDGMISSHAVRDSGLGIRDSDAIPTRGDVALRQWVVTGVIAAALVSAAVPLNAQTEKFTARLGWVPTAGPADRANVTGKGSATGTLTGRKFAITG